jgi:hypothetical protein
MHTGRFYSCSDFTGPSLRPQLSNHCFGSYSDIQLVCLDIKIVSNNWDFLPFQPPHRSHFLSKSRLLRISTPGQVYCHSIPYWLVEFHDGITDFHLFALFEQLVGYLASPRRGLFLMPYPVHFRG